MDCNGGNGHVNLIDGLSAVWPHCGDLAQDRNKPQSWRLSPQEGAPLLETDGTCDLMAWPWCVAACTHQNLHDTCSFCEKYTALEKCNMKKVHIMLNHKQHTPTVYIFYNKIFYKALQLWNLDEKHTDHLICFYVVLFQVMHQWSKKHSCTVLSTNSVF